MIGRKVQLIEGSPATFPGVLTLEPSALTLVDISSRNIASSDVASPRSRATVEYGLVGIYYIIPRFFGNDETRRMRRHGSPTIVLAALSLTHCLSLYPLPRDHASVFGDGIPASDKTLRSLAVQCGFPLEEETTPTKGSAENQLVVPDISPLLAPCIDSSPPREALQSSLPPTSGHDPLPIPAMVVPAISNRSASPGSLHRSPSSNQAETTPPPTSDSNLPYPSNSPGVPEDPSLSALPSMEAQNKAPLYTITRQAQGRSRFTQPPPPHVQGTGPSYFSNASGFNIQQQNIHNVQNLTPSKTVFEHLQPYVASGAAHDSAEECGSPRCSPETREAIQEEVVGLIRDGDRSQPSKKLIWLGGPAGAGKTAIAGSVAETCKASGLLVGSFFFSSSRGSKNRRSKRCVITTLANDLAGHEALHEYKAQLSRAIKANPGIFEKRLLDQAQRLIIAPLEALDPDCDISAWPRGILFDGLDEVQAVQHHDSARKDLQRNDEDDQLEILEVLLALVGSPAFPFRIFITSRPERIITDFFATDAQAFTIPLFLDKKYDPDADIKRFLRSRFAVIRGRFGIRGPWPAEGVIDEIVDMSSGQFIVPTTILRYIESGLPQRQLEDVMYLKRKQEGNKNPFALLDALYTHVINRSPDPHLVVVWIHCFNSISHIESSGADRTIPSYFWRQFFEDTEGEFYFLLSPLASLVSVPDHDDRSLPVHIYHKTLTDFLSSEIRCGDLYVCKDTWKAIAAGRCVRVLKDRGAKVSLPPSSALCIFIETFLSLSPLFQAENNRSQRRRLWTAALTNCCALFLGDLSEPLLTELGTCDVAWWTHLILTQDWKMEGSLIKLLGDLSPDGCHPACIHWRKGILDEARTLGWHVDKLQEVDVDDLWSVTGKDFEAKFHDPDPSRRRPKPTSTPLFMAWQNEAPANVYLAKIQTKSELNPPGPARPETHDHGTDKDIRRFLRSQFAGIRRWCGMSDPLWPGEEVINQITDMSSGELLLKNILLLQPVTNRGKGPFAMLEALYSFIIKGSPNPRLAVIWTHCMTFMHDNLPPGWMCTGDLGITLHFWEIFLRTRKENSFVEKMLEPITAWHKTLMDYLTSKARCGDLYVKGDTWRAFVAERCAIVLKNQGPAVHLLPPHDLSDFVEVLLSLDHLFQFGDTVDREDPWHTRSPVCVTLLMSLFLGHLSQSAAAELATCDVTWWTRLILARPDANSLAPFLEKRKQFKEYILGGIYCGIHSKLCNPGNAACHPACTHWRNGILAEARALGWCVHSLEVKNIQELSEVTTSEFGTRFIRPERCPFSDLHLRLKSGYRRGPCTRSSVRGRRRRVCQLKPFEIATGVNV
ncbi:hypothetical protein NMY22_g17996 [Coprinellus aureogranulatus]|nr:hypothetical protein NMY22_g17996 [Coprinellus aureogranulatus]